MGYDIKPLGVGEILDQAVKLVTSRFWLFFGIAGCISIPFGLALNFAMLGLMPQLPANPTPQDYQVFQQEMAPVMLPIALASILISVFVYPLTTGGMIHAVASEYLGNRTTIAESIGAAFKKFFPLLWTSFLMFLMVYLGFLMASSQGSIS